jgi:elongation factor Ts
LKPEDVDEEAKTKAKEVFAKEVADKPANIQEKIMEGKLQSYFGDLTLLNQSYIKNPDMTIKALIEAAIQKFGEKIEVARFARFGVLEK